MPDGFESPFDDESSSRPLPPDDRLWRHPSEVGGTGPDVSPTRIAPRVLTTVFTGLGMGLVVIGAIVMVGWLNSSPSLPDATSTRLEAHVVLVSSSTTTQTPLSPGWLGVSATDVPAGVEVTQCDAGSPAAGALRGGDVILEFNGTSVTKLSQLVAILEHSRPGAAAQIHIVRGGTPQTVKVYLARRP